MIVPDSIDPIIAWRAWRCAELLGPLSVQGVVQPGVPQYAQCFALRDHEAPSEGCACGIYALRTLEDVAGKISQELSRRVWFDGAIRIGIGQIYLWGKVVEHEAGWRAEYAYPKSILTANIGQATQIARRYNIEVETSCTWKQLFAPDELSFWALSSPLFASAGSFVGLSRSPSPAPTPVQHQKWNAQQLPATYQPTSALQRMSSNRSVPKQLRAQVAQKEENAKSEFWKRL